MAPFNMLMTWADLLPSLYMTSILDVEFFPKWLTVLHRWLSDTADYAEVGLLCSGLCICLLLYWFIVRAKKVSICIMTVSSVLCFMHAQKSVNRACT